MTKAAVFCGLVTFTEETLNEKLHFLCSVTLASVQVLKMTHLMFFNSFFVMFMTIKGKAPILLDIDIILANKGGLKQEIFLLVSTT